MVKRTLPILLLATYLFIGYGRAFAIEAADMKDAKVGQSIHMAYGGDVATENLAKKLNDVLIQGTSQKNWQIPADDVFAMIKEKKTDFLIVDVRPNPQEYKAGHIIGSIYIPYNEILKSENLMKLPRDKKVILVCSTGQNANLPHCSVACT